MIGLTRTGLVLALTTVLMHVTGCDAPMPGLTAARPAAARTNTASKKARIATPAATPTVVPSAKAAATPVPAPTATPSASPTPAATATPVGPTPMPLPSDLFPAGEPATPVLQATSAEPASRAFSKPAPGSALRLTLAGGRYASHEVAAGEPLVVWESAGGPSFEVDAVRLVFEPFDVGEPLETVLAPEELGWPLTVEAGQPSRLALHLGSDVVATLLRRNPEVERFRLAFALLDAEGRALSLPAVSVAVSR